MKVKFLWISILLALSLVALAQAPTPQNTYNVSIDTLRYEVDQSTGISIPFVQMAVTVTGTNGDGIRGLDVSNFRIEQGSTSIPPIMEDFTSAQVGVRVVLCIDASGSMRGQPLQQMKEAISAYVDSLRPQDYVSIITFGDSYDVVAPFTNDKNYLKSTIEGIQASGSYSSLYYGVYQSILKLREGGQSLERRFVIVISDGKNESLSDAYDIDDCIEAAQADGVIISTIGFTNENPQYLQNLEAMAQGTGGTYNYGAGNAASLNQQLMESILLLRSQYFLAFTPPPGRTSDAFEVVIRSTNFIGSAGFDVSSVMTTHACPICGQLYNTASESQQCIDSHRNTCPHCGSEFGDQEALELHIQSEHHWECPHYDSVFTTEALLNQHIANVHIACPSCGEVFASQGELEQHILDEMHYTCQNCDSTFVSQEALDTHMEDCKPGIPILPIVGGVLVFGGIIFVILLMRKKSKAKMEALQAEMQEREEELQRKNRRIEQEAKAAAEPKRPKAGPGSTETLNSSYDTQTYSGDMGGATQAAHAAPPRDPRKTMIGDSVATQYTQGLLEVMDGPHQGVTFDLAKGQVTLGRASDNFIVIDDDTVSGHHAVIRFAAGMFQLTDTDSTNGTYVNGERISQSILKSGDIVRLGTEIELKFQGS